MLVEVADVIEAGRKWKQALRRRADDKRSGGLRDSSERLLTITGHGLQKDLQNWGRRCQAVDIATSVLFRTETAELTNAVPFLSNDSRYTDQHGDITLVLLLQ